MRTWRVGTISMGLSLLFLGIFLLLSQVAGLSLTHIMISWWPLILIVLGAEILTYLFLARKEKPLLKYDFLSIFFVGIIGMVGTGFALLSSIGLLDLIDESLSREEQTLELPTLAQKVDTSISRVVLNAESYPINVEATNNQEVSIFGTYTSYTAKKEKRVSKVEDYLSINQKGDTLYISVKRLPTETNPFHHYDPQLEATVLVPDNVRLEMVGHNDYLTLKPRALKSDWMIENASDVSLYIEENSDIEVKAQKVNELISVQDKWVINQTDKNNPEESGNTFQSGSFKMGDGSHSIKIMGAYQVSLNINE